MFHRVAVTALCFDHPDRVLLALGHRLTMLKRAQNGKEFGQAEQAADYAEVLHPFARAAFCDHMCGVQIRSCDWRLSRDAAKVRSWWTRRELLRVGEGC